MNRKLEFKKLWLFRAKADLKHLEEQAKAKRIYIRLLKQIIKEEK